jgi:hypothetical protein
MFAATSFSWLKRMRGYLIALALAAAVAFGISLLNYTADFFGYALPWHTPPRIVRSGRIYVADTLKCIRDPQPLQLQQVDTMFGWLRKSIPLYAERTALRPGFDPPLLFAACDGRSAYIDYVLQGGP